jgi:hypothetical protein
MRKLKNSIDFCSLAGDEFNEKEPFAASAFCLSKDKPNPDFPCFS